MLRVKSLREEGMSLTAIAALMEYEEAIYALKVENDVLKNQLEETQVRLGNVENRLHEVESTIETNSRALVKVPNRDVVLVIQEGEKNEKQND